MIFSEIFVLFSFLGVISCVHFNSAILTAKPIRDPGTAFMTVEYTVRIGYTRTRHFCNETTIANGAYLSEVDNIQCVVGCTLTGCSRCEIVGTTRVKCTAFSILNDWITGEEKFTVDVPKRKFHAVSAARGDWRALNMFTNNISKSWEYRITLDTTTRADIGVMNTSPTTFVPPVIQLRVGLRYVLKIPTYDVDGDIMRCRWAEGALGECAGICKTVPFGDLDSVGCKLVLDLRNTSRYSIGWYGAALQIEDFQTSTSTAAMSSIPVQFLINIAGNGSNCEAPPQIPADSCIAVPANSTFEGKIVATVRCSGGSITEIQVVGPFGTQSTAAAPLPGSTTKWFSEVSWSPDPTSVGGNMICVLATDDNSMSSELSCYTVVYGYYPPILVNTTGTPRGLLSSSSLLGVNGFIKFQITFSADIQTPIRSSFIRIYFENSTEVMAIEAKDSSFVSFNGRTMTFNVPVYTFVPGNYYILFDLGVGLGYRALPKLCDPDSAEINDPTFWTFSVPSSNLSLLGLDEPCKNAAIDQTNVERFSASVSYPGVAYIKSIEFTGPTGFSSGPLTLLSSSGETWYKDFIWYASSSDLNSLKEITVTVKDNLDQVVRGTFNITVTNILTNPTLKPGSGWPSGVLTESFLSGSNGFMTFKVQFKASANRPTSPVYLRVYTSSGLEYTKIDCSTSGFVYYIDNTMFFDLPVNTFPPQAYYVLFDQGIATSQNPCIPVSPAVTSNTFWQFSVLANHTGQGVETTTRSNINKCNSIIVNVQSYTKCSQSSLILLLFLLPGSYFILHLTVFITIMSCYKPPKTKSHTNSNYFKLFVPSSYIFSAEQKS